MLFIVLYFVQLPDNWTTEATYLYIAFYLSKIVFFCRGKEFRNDFQDLSVLKAFFPNVPTIALTATAPPQLLKSYRINCI